MTNTNSLPQKMKTNVARVDSIFLTYSSTLTKRCFKSGGLVDKRELKTYWWSHQERSVLLHFFKVPVSSLTNSMENEMMMTFLHWNKDSLESWQVGKRLQFNKNNNTKVIATFMFLCSWNRLFWASPFFSISYYCQRTLRKIRSSLKISVYQGH